MATCSSHLGCSLRLCLVSTSEHQSPLFSLPQRQHSGKESFFLCPLLTSLLDHSHQQTEHVALIVSPIKNKSSDNLISFPLFISVHSLLYRIPPKKVFQVSFPLLLTFMLISSLPSFSFEPLESGHLARLMPKSTCQPV